MVHNVDIQGVIRPCSRRTYVRLERNSTYDLQTAPFVSLLPPNVLEDEGDGTDDEYEQRNRPPIHNVPPPHASPAHTPPFTYPFTGTSTGHHFTEEMLRKQRDHEEERDSLLYAMYEHQWDAMDFMRESLRQTERSMQAILESQHTIASQQQRHQAYMASHFNLIEMNQTFILGKIRRLQESNTALTTQVEQLEISQSAHHHSRSCHPRRSYQGGEGTSGQQQHCPGFTYRFLPFIEKSGTMFSLSVGGDIFFLFIFSNFVVFQLVLIILLVCF